EVAVHQTGHNSGVLHSGIYYKPGSTKAETCRAGRKAMIEFCLEHDIAHEIEGKVIVATETSQIGPLDALEARAAENAVATRRLDAAALRELEPNAAGIGALHVPDAGIVDFKAVCRVLAQSLTDVGVTIRTEAEVSGLAESDREVMVTLTNDEHLSADLVVTCGGLQSDRLARMVQPDLAEQ
ncbi:MAG: FAD-dependent oxidoreductase, partial [Actinomycetia bacterium]|nr:FAD-dependent oxidoreductase [Actinomycetes bacterium]